MTTHTCNSIREWLEMFAHKEAYAIILLIVSPITTLLNLTLIISFIATKQVTQNTSNILIFVLSWYDLIAGAVSMPLTANIFLDFNSDDSCIKVQLLFILSSKESFSLLMNFLLALDRYLHMNPDIQARPSRLQKILNTPSIYFVIVLTVITSNVISVIAAFQFYEKSTLIANFTFTGLLLMQLVVVACLYTKGYLRIRKFADSSPVYSQPMGSTPDYVRKLYKTVLVILSLAFIQYVPFCVISILLAVHSNATQLISNPVFAYSFEIATLSTNAGCFTNCLAILHFNDRAKNWIFKKSGCRGRFQQHR